MVAVAVWCAVAIDGGGKETLGGKETFPRAVDGGIEAKESNAAFFFVRYPGELQLREPDEACRFQLLRC